MCGSDLELYKIREKDEYVLNIRVEKVRHKFYEYKCPKDVARNSRLISLSI